MAMVQSHMLLVAEEVEGKQMAMALDLQDRRISYQFTLQMLITIAIAVLLAATKATMYI
ncbi:hypothetical protein KY290_007222 [Solanum tuberosum]|uniref:Uncharacterized protein n=1 Tax=Solanum tuberosum TaxID=4113 RepID=A0ABQ7W4X7_SOLTU|nr:hypothetical protein KY290_007222 [Solanum tuberosum]